MLQETRNTFYDAFIKALEYLNSPELKMKEWMEKIVEVLNSPMDGQSKTKELALLELRFKEFFESDMAGNVWTQFKHKNRKAFDLISSCRDEKKLRSIALEKVTEPSNVSAFSPWLTKFSKFHTNISHPFSEQEHQVTIVDVDSGLLIMNSLRRPKRIIIQLSDKRSCKVLVKNGEDLRLDQRIQQLFELCNGILRKNPKTRSFSLRTFQVKPMTSNLGLIEWIDETKPLKESIEVAHGNLDDFAKSKFEYHNWVNSKYKGFHDMFIKAKQEEVLRIYEKCQSRFENNSLLRKHFWKICNDPESFLNIKLQFSNSLATMNICHYLLGIGDRHLDNFLLDGMNGELIGIDFGHAFGSATEVLPVPEMVPFRFTPQIKGVFQPFKAECFLHASMTAILQGTICITDRASETQAFATDSHGYFYQGASFRLEKICHSKDEDIQGRSFIL